MPTCRAGRCSDRLRGSRRVDWIPLGSVVDLISNGEILGSGSLVALLTGTDAEVDPSSRTNATRLPLAAAVGAAGTGGATPAAGAGLPGARCRDGLAIR
jgi:hypothetical protein